MRNAKNIAMCLFLTGLLFSPFFAHAAPMDGEPIIFTQPDGTVIQLAVYGDEFYAETRTLDGFTVYFDSTVKAYYYAALSADGNELISSGILVRPGKSPAGLPKKLRISKQSRLKKINARLEESDRETGQSRRWEAIKEKSRQKRMNRLRTKQAASIQSGPAFAAADGDGGGGATQPSPPNNETVDIRVGLTILVEFPDVAGTISQQEVDDYGNKPGYSGFSNDGSIYDFFYTQSDGRLRYYNVVTPYVMAPHPKTYYNDTTKSSGYCGRLLLNDILQELITSGFDFSFCTTNSSGRLHAINMFFAGSNSGVWSKGLWPHKYGLSPDVPLGNGMYADQYQTSNMGTSLKISTFCHENGHLICGFPDVYDYDGDSRGNGRYTFMSSSGKSTHPGSAGAYLRYHAGWAEVIGINTNSHLRAAVRVDKGPLYQFVNPANVKEYFMIENRAKIGWENGSNLPDQGLLIAHCDEQGNHNHQDMSESRHYETSVEQADGLFHLENDNNTGGANDLFHNGYKTDFDDTTLPNAHWWKNADSNDMTSGDASGLDIHTISGIGETMTFIVGTGALTNDPIVGVDRTLLEPRTFQGSSPPNDDFAVWNMGGGTLTYSVTSLTSWIECTPKTGTATAESDLITVSYDTAALGSGTHAGEINIINNADTTDVHVLDVELTVEPSPLLAAAPTSLTVTGATERTMSGIYLMLNNAGGSSLSYTLSGMPSWCSVSSSAGTIAKEADNVVVGFNATGLSTGTYNGSITITSPEASNSPVAVPLTFVVEDLVLYSLDADLYTNAQTVSLEWLSSTATYSLVDIELWKDGALQTVIADNTANDDLYEWTIPDTLLSGSNYTIRVAGDGAATYKETAPFTVWLYHESFEDGFGTWGNSTNDTANWKTRSGKTPTNPTGPARASEGSYYIFTEANNHHNETAALTNSFNLYPYGEAQLIFDYHMYGAKMGSLHVDIFNGQDWTESIWSRTGQQHTATNDPWSTAVVDLSPWTVDGDLTIRFRGNIGDGNKSDMAVDNLRMLNIANAVDYSLTIAPSTHGTPSPAAGVHTMRQDTVVTCSVDSVVTAGQTRYVCSGWDLSGLEPASGGTNSVVFALTNNASLTWNWATNFYLTTAAASNGSVDTASQWLNAGQSKSVGVVADTYYHFGHWTGDASGSVTPVLITMSAPKSVTAHFAENLVTNNIPEWWLAANGLGITDADALTDTDLDGLLNWEEFYAGTIITNPASVLTLTEANAVTNGFIIKWQAVAGKTYSVLYKADLFDPAWDTNATGIVGIEPECTHTVVTENASAYVRIMVEE